jgi:ribosomal protein S19
MARSSWKFVPVNRFYWKLVYNIRLYKSLLFLKKNDLKNKEKIDRNIRFLKATTKRQTTHRFLPITESYINVTLLVHKGNHYQKLFPEYFLIGRKLGEFIFTRKPFKYPIKKKNKNFIRR